MKWLYTLVLLLVVSSPIVGVSAPVTFNDPNLKAAVEAELGVTDPNTDDMLNLIGLFAQTLGITDLTGLETAENLEFLGLADNDLPSIQTTIFAPLTKLSFLDLQRNQIGSVPAHAFATLGDLELLVLRGNQITTVDEQAFSGLTSLVSLYMEYNDLATLPSNVFAPLTSLTLLDLSGTQLTTVPTAALAPLTVLEELDLGGNLISSIPAHAFATLGALAELQLYGNQITTLDEQAFVGLSSLEVLDLVGNDLVSLPAHVFDPLLVLEALILAENEITSLPATVFSSLLALDVLVLEGNLLTTLPPGIFTNLTDLDILDLESNRLRTLPATVFHGLVDLFLLDLEHNELSALSPQLFSGLADLKFLNLEDNRLRSLPADIFADLISLIHLELDENQLRSLPTDLLAGTPDLQFLDLDRNQLSYLPASFFAHVPNLEELDLHDNQFRDISSFMNIFVFDELDLTENKLNKHAHDVVIPNIEANNLFLTVYVDPYQPLLSVSSTLGGTVTNPGIGEFCYDANDLVKLAAQANPGYRFSHWSGPVFTFDNPAGLVLDSDHEMRAHFVSTRDVLYVDANNVDDPAQTGSPAHPIARLQDAVDVAPEGTTIIVRPGTYHAPLRVEHKSLHITSADPNQPEIFTYPVLTSVRTPVIGFSGHTSTSRLEGFVIQGGDGGSTSALACFDADLALAHCLVVGHRTPQTNGVIVRCHDSRVTIDNCTLADNATGPAGSGLALLDSEVLVTNSILWQTGAESIRVLSGADPNVMYCTVSGGYAGEGNGSADPLFAQPGFWAQGGDPNLPVPALTPGAQWIPGDYHLQSTEGRWDPIQTAWITDVVNSPALDAGDPNAAFTAEPEPHGARLNQGTYGGTDQASLSPVVVTP